MIPLAGVIISGAAKAGAGTAVAKATADIGQALAGVFGETAKDKQRKAEAADLQRRLYAGDQTAMDQLFYNAFEPTRGLPNDSRRPVKGDRSPQVVRDASKKILKTYFESTNRQVPTRWQQYATALNAEAEAPSATQQIIRGILQPSVDTITGRVGEAAVDAAEARWLERLKTFVPILLVLVLVIVLLRKS